MIEFKAASQATVDVGELVKDLLGIEPGDLAPSGEVEGQGAATALTGVGKFMRRILELAITLGGREDLIVRMKTEQSAGEHGWPSEAVANLGMLFVWSLVQARRRMNGLSFAPLDAPASGAADRPVRIQRRLRAMSIDELLVEFDKPTARQGDVFEQANLYPISVRAMISPMLGLDPATLHLYRSDLACNGLDPEILARFGLEGLVKDVFAQYRTMRERGTSAIRLMSGDDAVDAMIPGARAGRIATLLAAALLAQTTPEPVFLAPKPRSEEEKAMLRETAKLVYGSYSEEAMRGFELVCDGIVHFGHGPARTIAEKLLRAVARDCDPDLQAVPYSVSMQLWLEALEDIASPSQVD